MSLQKTECKILLNDRKAGSNIPYRILDRDNPVFSLMSLLYSGGALVIEILIMAGVAMPLWTAGLILGCMVFAILFGIFGMFRSGRGWGILGMCLVSIEAFLLLMLSLGGAFTQ